ncbi:transcription elongation regulator 1-like protein [Ambystoma mexicanum]|uniref:transcription elongation regulator 1-like protein n=1 Tax=Ambystoma mexicanum TaxID=8296 RepID=UPI0037E8F1A1
MLPVPRFKRQPVLWQMTTEAHPWIWMLPAPAGLFRIGAVPHPFLVSSPPAAPFLQGVPGWQLPCDPFLPLMSVPSAPEPAVHQYTLPNGQWVFGGHSPVAGFAPSPGVEFAPVFPPVYAAAVPPRAGKRWLKKRIPTCKMYINSSFSLDSAFVHPEEPRIFPEQDTPLLMANQLSVAISRPPTVSRPCHRVILTPQTLTGRCQTTLKHMGSSNQTIAITTAAAATMMGVDSEAHQGPSTSTVQPCCVLTLSPIKLPILTTPFSSSISRVDSHVTSLIPAQLASMTAVSTPAVTFMTSKLVDKASSDKNREVCRTSTSTALILHTDMNNMPNIIENKDHSIKPRNEEDCLPKGNKPVASTPVPGSPWCIVWTGDDRVFFFNPKMQLSVWEKPVDLKNRGDINKMIEDPPHKRKLETSASNQSDDSSPDGTTEEQSTKTKRNRIELDENTDHQQLDVDGKTMKPSKETPTLEERSTHFKDMLLERGVSAFSTWEKELHKIVFDPRYLLLNSEERKQVFEQFVKTRIKEEYKEKKCKLLLAKEGFKKLLEESKVSPRTTFKEFAEKYSRDQRFRLVQKKKDQELVFNQFINLLKKRDKENRLRLRKMR